jgi:S-formylglutathione hydrolase FrmB
MMIQNKTRFAGKFLWILLIFLVPLGGNAQKVKLKASERVLDTKIESKLMKRAMPYRVILPTDYNNSNEKKFYPVIYLLHGLTGHFNDWSDQAKLEEYTSPYKYIIVMPEGENGWYTDSEMVSNDKYESYIIKELIPEVEKKYRVKKERESRLVAGLSMGGYGSLKFGLKYPDKFIVAGSFSGALRAAESLGQDYKGWKVFSDSINTTFGDARSQTRKDNDIFKILESKTKDQLKDLPFFYIDCGTEDGLLKQNQDFARLLLDQKVPHEFRQLPGKHNWQFWDSQIQEFLYLSQKYIK